MAASSPDHDSLDRSLAHQARLAFPAINAVLKLEESLLAIGIHIIGDRGSAQLYRFFQDLFQSLMQLRQLIASNR